jgi:hypothetical protein
MKIGTQQVELYEIPGTNIYLADSPGFGDTYRNDAAILADLDEALAEIFHEKVKLAGVLFLHSLLEARIKGGARRNLIVLGKLVGTQNLHKCRLVTTKVSALQRAPEEIESRLCNNPNFWMPLLERGAKVVRFMDSQNSAHQIIQSLLGSSGVVLKLTSETQIKHRNLEDTAAGQEVDQEILRAKKDFRAAIGRLKTDHRKAMARKDFERARLVEEEKDEVREKLRQLDRDREILKTKARASSFRRLRWGGRICATVAAGSAIIASEGLLTPVVTPLYSAVNDAIQRWR